MNAIHRIVVAIPSRLALVAGLVLSLVLPVHADPATIVVEVHGLRSPDGEVLGALYGSEDGWAEPGSEIRSCRARITRDGHATCRFRNAEPGTYGVAILHDENRSGAIDRNLVGIPSEGFGFSNDAAPGLGGPPSFADASFEHSRGETRIRIRARYGL